MARAESEGRRNRLVGDAAQGESDRFRECGRESGSRQRDLRAHPEVISEAIQTVLRREGVEVPYEKLKELTRGKKVSLDDFAEFIDGLSVNDEVKTHLKSLRPEAYIGLAERIARHSP